jgi:hypothetical protein
MPSNYAMSVSLPVPYKEEEMMDDATLSSSMSSLEELPLSDDALRALMSEADHSLQRAHELQRAALWHVYHSDSSASADPMTTATSLSEERKGSMVSTTSTSTGAVDTDLLLSTATTLGEGTLFRLATALSYYKESTVHMERYQSLQARIASQHGSGGNASGTGSDQGDNVHRWNIVPETNHLIG